MTYYKIENNYYEIENKVGYHFQRKNKEPLKNI
jgi:hypothetical protein